MRRTWVYDSRPQLPRRRKSLNALTLEPLEDRLALSATSSGAWNDVELLSMPAASVAPAVIAPFDLDADGRFAARDAEAHPGAPYAAFPLVPATFNSAAGEVALVDVTSSGGTSSGFVDIVSGSQSLSPFGGTTTIDAFSGFRALPDVFTHFEFKSLETSPLDTSRLETIDPTAKTNLDGGLPSVGIVIPGANRGFGLVSTIGIESASQFIAGALQRDITLARMGLPIRFSAFDVDLPGHTELFVTDVFDHGAMHAEVEMTFNHALDVIMAHGAEGDPQGPAAKVRSDFQAIFGARDQSLNQARPDGSTRLQPATNFAADSSVAAAGLAGQRAAAAPWIVDGPSAVHVAASEREAAAGADLLFGPRNDADHGMDASQAAKPSGSSGRQGSRYGWSASDMWRELPYLASLATDYFTSDEAAAMGTRGVQSALLSTLTLNSAALDQALDNVVGEIEKLGGDVVTWLDRMRVPPWTVTTVVVTAVGTGMLARRWRNRQADGSVDDEESSTWLFTRLHSTLG